MTQFDPFIIAQRFKALSHPKRARVFELLATRPACGNSLNDLCAATGFQHTTLVHHLREMERCGLLRRIRKGQKVIHRLTLAPLDTAIDQVRLAHTPPRPASSLAA